MCHASTRFILIKWIVTDTILILFIYQVLEFPDQSPNSVAVEFTPFWGYLQLDHPVTCENIKCYLRIQIIT